MRLLWEPLSHVLTGEMVLQNAPGYPSQWGNCWQNFPQPMTIVSKTLLLTAGVLQYDFARSHLSRCFLPTCLGRHMTFAAVDAHDCRQTLVSGDGLQNPLTEFLGHHCFFFLRAQKVLLKPLCTTLIEATAVLSPLQHATGCAICRRATTLHRNCLPSWNQTL